MSSLLLRAIGAAVLAVAVFAAGWSVNGWRKDAEIERMRTATALADLADANKAIEDIGKASNAIRTKADEYAGINSTLGAKLDAIRKDMKNAKPLPVDCRPDDFRVRKLSDAVDAAKQAAAAR